MEIKVCDIIDEVNEAFQNGQVVFRGKTIPRLIARAMDLRDQYHKIPVTERLPHRGRTVLVFEYIPQDNEYYPGLGFLGIDDKWYVSSFAGQFEPTHWVDVELRENA